MANDIASLGIKIDTSDVQKAESDLDKLARAGANAEQAATKTGAAWTQAGDKMGKVATPAAKVSESFKQGSAALKAQQAELAALIGKIDPVAAAYGRLDDQLASLRKFKTAGLLDTESFRDYSAKIEAARNSLGGMETAIRKTGISSAQTANAMRQMPAQITDIFTSLAGGQNPLLVLIQQGGQIKDSFGGIGNTFQALKEHVRGLFSSASSVDADGLLSIGAGLASIAEQQAALAQGAQPASEGLGSLADSANSATETAGNARGAIGGLGLSAGAATGLFVVAAAAAAALALAYKQGSDEATAYSKAIILTGNAAGTSADSLGSMAKAVGDSTTTTGAAADALNQLASTGKIAEAQFSSLATAAVNFNEATGKAVSETVAEFAKLADDPVRASESLNQQYNYLTAAVYEQIQALQEQGDKAGAAALAEESYANALKGRAEDIKASLGVIETAWNAVGLTARQAWDQILGIGRPETFTSRIKELKAQLAEIDSAPPALQASRERFGGAKRSDVVAQLAAVELDKALSDKGSAYAGDQARRQRDGIAAERELQALREAGATKDEKHAKELEDYAKRKANLLAANPFSKAYDGDKEARDIAEINGRYAEKEVKARKPAAEKAAPAYQDDAATKMLQSLREQGAALNEQLTTTGKLTQAEQAQVKFAQLIADLKTKDILTADQKSLLLNQDSIKAQLDKNAAVAGEVAQRAELNKLTERGAQLQETMAASLQSAKEQHSDELGSSGLGDKAAEQIKAQAAIRKQYQKFQRDLDKATPEDLLGSSDYKAEVNKIKEGLDSALNESSDYYKELDKQQRDWAKGAEKGFNNFLDNAADLSGQMADIVQGTMESVTAGIGDSFADALVKGEDLRTSLQNLSETILTSVISALTQMGIRYGINAALETTAIETVTAAKVAAAATSTTAAVASTTTVAAAQAPAAAATATAWAPAAATASVASFGGAAAIGLAALVAVLAISRGFKTGGYTGDGGTSDVAGVVHGKEFVFDAAATSRIGVSNLESMRSGKVVNIGTPMAASQSAPAASSQQSNVTNINLSLPGITSKNEAREASGSIARKVSGAVGRSGRYS